MSTEATSAEETRPPMRRRAPAARTVFAIASLGIFMAFVDATIVNIAFPDIGRSFPESDISSLSWVLNAYNIVFAAFLVACGRLTDLLGRRRIYLLGLAVFTVSSALCAVAPSTTSLVAFRVLQALGAALLVPSSFALVLEAFPVERRSHAVALLAAVGAVAAGIGPSLGGLLVGASSWRLVFLVNVPIGIAAYLLTRRELVESRAPGRRRMPDLLGALVLAFSVGLLVLAVVKGQEWGWGSPRIVGCFLAAVVLGAYFARRCARHPSPLIDLDLLRDRTFSVANAMTIVASAGFYGYTLTNVLYLTGVWSYSVLEAGLALTPGPFVAAAIAGPTSRLASRFGHRPLLAIGGLWWGAAVLWFVTQVGPTPDFLGEWLPGMVLLGIGAGTMYPNLAGAAVASAAGESYATSTSLNSVARQLGAAIGVAIVVAIIGAPTILNVLDVFDSAWTFAAVCLIGAGIGCLAIARIGVDDETARTPDLATAARLVFAAPDPPAPEIPREPALTRPPHDGEPAPGPPQPETTADFLGHAPIFAGLAEPLRETLAQRSTAVHLAAGEWLFREGDPGESMYVVRAGRLEVVAEGAQEVVVRELGRGAALGELALLTSEPRSASVRAARDADLIAIERDEFERLLETAPEISLALNRVLASQLRQSRGVVASTRPLPVTVALTGLDQRVPLRELAERLAEGLGRRARVTVLDGSEATSDDADPAATYGPVLDRAEAASDLVILAAGPVVEPDAWTRFCLQQADRVLAAGSGGEPPAGGELAVAALRGCDLVAYDVAEGSGGLAAWARLLDPIETHALRSGAGLEADFSRMARRLTGRSLGIVLSGGGARAFSHIGVLDELVAAGLEIDRVAGVSMGAYVGAMFALGMDHEEIDARAYDEWVRRRPLADYTFPRHSLLRGDRIRAMFERTFGDVAIEELRRSFFCGCADLRTAALVVDRHGSLLEAVGNSVRMPVLGPPEVRGRQLLVDGSLVDNLPVSTMAALGEGPIIAVDVKASFERSADPRRGGGDEEPTANPIIRPPALGETLTRVLLLGSANTSEAARRHADLTIRPRNVGVGLLEFHQLDRAIEAGRAAAREALEQAPPRLFA